MAVKRRFEDAPWSEWAEDIRKRWSHALDYYRRECYFEIEFLSIFSSNSVNSGAG